MRIDSDGHLYEPRGMWTDYAPNADRDLALRIETDGQGFDWLTFQGERTETLAWVTRPGDFEHLGELRTCWRAGAPNPDPTYMDMPLDFWEPATRAESVRRWGLDECVLFPQFGFMWEYTLADEPAATKVNMAAWNRWAIEVVQTGGGALHPVGHVSLQAEPEWLREQLRLLSDNGIRMAMCVPGLIHGKRVSHPDVEPVWKAFVDFGVTPAWHVSAQMSAILDDWRAWCDNDTHSSMKLVTTLFQRVAPQVALLDMALNGVFFRHPTLQVVVAEIGSDWLPPLIRRLDKSTATYGKIHGVDFNPELTMLPSDYIRRQVKIICSFPGDVTPELLTDFGEMLAFGGDYPHPEGLAEPLRNYEELVGPLDEPAQRRLYGDTISPLLHAP